MVARTAWMIFANAQLMFLHFPRLVVCTVHDQWIDIAVSSGAEEVDVDLRYPFILRRILCPFLSSGKASADFEAGYTGQHAVADLPVRHAAPPAPHQLDAGPAVARHESWTWME